MVRSCSFGGPGGRRGALSLCGTTLMAVFLQTAHVAAAVPLIRLHAEATITVHAKSSEPCPSRCQIAYMHVRKPLGKQWPGQSDSQWNTGGVRYGSWRFCPSKLIRLPLYLHSSNSVILSAVLAVAVDIC